MTVLCGIDVDWSGCLDYPIPFSFITSHALCTKLTSDPPCPVKRLGLDVWMFLGLVRYRLVFVLYHIFILFLSQVSLYLDSFLFIVSFYSCTSLGLHLLHACASWTMSDLHYYYLSRFGRSPLWDIGPCFLLGALDFSLESEGFY
uniref:Ovule protein n=1 Tax=Strongyloides venezuelensis TaxID=75913 RepID=A0A0K0FFE7_STRVS